MLPDVYKPPKYRSQRISIIATAVFILRFGVFCSGANDLRYRTIIKPVLSVFVVVMVCIYVQVYAINIL